MKILTQKLGSTLCVVLSIFYAFRGSKDNFEFNKFVNFLKLHNTYNSSNGITNVSETLKVMKTELERFYFGSQWISKMFPIFHDCVLIKRQMIASPTGYHYFVAFRKDNTIYDPLRGILNSNFYDWTNVIIINKFDLGWYNDHDTWVKE